MPAEERRGTGLGPYVADEETVRLAEDLRRKIASGELVGETAEEIRAFIESGEYRFKPKP